MISINVPAVLIGLDDTTGIASEPFRTAATTTSDSLDAFTVSLSCN